VAFGNQSVAGGAKLLTVTVTNTSTAPLRITSITQSSYTHFPAPTVTCPISPATLAGGASCTVTARFDPTSAGAKSATMAVNVVGPATRQTVAMTGTGILP
jgi:hypothetical protein